MNSYQLFGIFNIKLRKSYFGSLFFDSETDLTVGEGCFGGIGDGRANRLAIDKEVKGGTHGDNNEYIAFARTTGKRRSGAIGKAFPATIPIVAQELILSAIPAGNFKKIVTGLRGSAAKSYAIVVAPISFAMHFSHGD